MCFYARINFNCGDWKWGNMKQRCSRQPRIGETCNTKLVDTENLTIVDEDCGKCQKKAVGNRRQKHGAVQANLHQMPNVYSSTPDNAPIQSPFLNSFDYSAFWPRISRVTHGTASIPSSSAKAAYLRPSSHVDKNDLSRFGSGDSTGFRTKSTSSMTGRMSREQRQASALDKCTTTKRLGIQAKVAFRYTLSEDRTGDRTDTKRRCLAALAERPGGLSSHQKPSNSRLTKTFSPSRDQLFENASGQYPRGPFNSRETLEANVRRALKIAQDSTSGRIDQKNAQLLEDYLRLTLIDIKEDLTPIA